MTTSAQAETLAKREERGVLQVLEHLQQILPLKKRQQALPPPLRTVHRAILTSLATTGKVPRQAEIAAMLGSKQAAVHALSVLGKNDLVILNSPVRVDEQTKQPVTAEDAEVLGAYPMTTENTPHKVVFGEHSVNAMCAVDALAIGPVFGVKTRIDSKCHVTGTPIRIQQQGAEIIEANPSQEIRVGIRWQPVNNTCAAHTLCTEMIFLKDQQVAEAWSMKHGSGADVMTLPEAIELGVAFFTPLLEE
jgi:mercuric reductase